jgi:hypothetical protein
MSIRRATQQNIPFPAIDVTNPPARKSGLVWSAGYVQISKDGGSFVNTTSLPVEINASGRYYVTLTPAEMDAGWIMLKIETPYIQPYDISLSTGGHPTGTVVSDVGNIPTAFTTTLVETTADYWRNVLVLFTSGTLFGQVRKAIAYNGVTKVITVDTAFTSTPTAGDYFVLVNY